MQELKQMVDVLVSAHEDVVNANVVYESARETLAEAAKDRSASRAFKKRAIEDVEKFIKRIKREG